MRIRPMAAPVIVTLTMGAILLPAPAFAGSDSPLSSTTGATAKFRHTNNDIRVCDTSSDGYSVFAHYKINEGSQNNTSQHNGGNNTCGNKGISVSEGASVAIRAVRQVEGGFDNTGDWKYGTA